jgi:hypothetical protein
MPYKDPEVRKIRHREYMRNRYKNDSDFRLDHKKRVRSNDSKYRQNVKKVLDEWKKYGCSLCGEMELCCLAAHHLDPQQKDFALARAKSVNSE